jgi:hypothetical protein
MAGSGAWNPASQPQRERIPPFPLRLVLNDEGSPRYNPSILALAVTHVTGEPQRRLADAPRLPGIAVFS